VNPPLRSLSPASPTLPPPLPYSPLPLCPWILFSRSRAASPPALPARARPAEAAAVPGPATTVVQAPVAAAAVVGAPLALPPPRLRMRPPPRCPPRLPRPRHLAVHLRRVIRIRGHLLSQVITSRFSHPLLHRETCNRHADKGSPGAL
jgi:hypothetical protein